MISQISVTNFFSLRDPAILDLKITNSRSFNKQETQENVFIEDGMSLLKSIAIFGANASGKSNVLKALELCVRYIRESHNYTESNNLNFEPFKFLDTPLPSSFCMELVIDGEKYEYGFSLQSNQVVEEYLYSYPKKYKALIFKRTTNPDGTPQYAFSKKFMRPRDVVANTSQYTLFLTRAAMMNRMEAVKIFNFITNRVVIGLPSFDGPVFESMLMDHKDTVLQALRYADSDIVDYEFKESAVGESAKKLVTYHKSDPSKPFNFDNEESGGTRRLLRLLTAFIDAADNGKVLIIDELETSLHPHLVKYAIKMFNRSEKSQLIFSTHDLELLNVSVLRPDQIYFVAKDYISGSTELYSLSDFTDYKNYKNLRRDYEQGRFDAVPLLPTI